MNEKKENLYKISIIFLDILLIISLIHGYKVEKNCQEICDETYKPLAEYYEETHPTTPIGLYKELNENGTLSEKIYLREEIK